jgi:NTE family protein
MAEQMTALILQGGGALGAYQAGVFAALSAQDYAPDWIIGTSIGAINGAIIAGNPPATRVQKLRNFWDGMAPAASWTDIWSPVMWAEALNPFAALMGVTTQDSAVLSAMSLGIEGFFSPRIGASLNVNGQVSITEAGFYDTSPLRRTLLDLVDFDYLNAGKVRLSVSAVDIATGELAVFDTKDKAIITPEHIMASGALPPAFPPIVIGDRAFWDGGLHSNTPLEFLLGEAPERDALVFMIDLWDPTEAWPDTMAQVMARQKAIQYSSRMDQQLKIDQRLETLQQVIRTLATLIPPDILREPETAALTSLGCDRTIQIVRLILKNEPNADQFRDVDFSAATVNARWNAGTNDAARALKHKSWLKPVPPHSGLIIHELEQE